MAKLGISTGAVPDDGTGSSLLVGAARVNSNFDELYTLLGAGSTTNLAPGIVTSIVGGDNINVSGSGQVTITGSAGTAFVNTASLNVAGISTFGGSVTASTFTGNLTGNASGNAGTVTVTAENSTAATVYPLFGGNGATATGNFSPSTDTGFTYNPSTGELTTVQLTGTNANVTGILTAANVSTAGSVTAATFYGNGANLTGVGGGSTAFVDTASLTVAGVSTFSGLIDGNAGLTVSGGDLVISGENITLGNSASGADDRIVFGSGGDLNIYYNGTSSLIEANDLRLRNAAGDESFIVCTDDAAVDIYYNGTKRFETTGQGTLTTGIASATSFSGHGNDLVTSQWAVANSGSSHYTFTGPGNLSAAEDPTMYLARGQTYEFVLNASGHPFRIQTTSGAYDAGTQYETGVTNPGAAVGTIKFQIPFNAPNTLYYVCQNHSAMAGTLTIYPSI